MSDDRPRSPARPPLGLILNLDDAGADKFRGHSHTPGARRIYGGQTVGQALMAAGHTVSDGRTPHSLHATFLRAGDPALPTTYHVERIRDSGRFSSRRVLATQNDSTIAEVTASFQVAEEGLRLQTPVGHALAPEHVGTLEDTLPSADLASSRRWLAALRRNVAVEFRFPEEYPRVASARGEPRPPRQRAWVRSPEKLPDDALYQAAGFAYLSDLFLLSSALAPHAITVDDPRLQLASLDHSVWFHDRFRSDEWQLYEQEAVWMGGGRGLSRGHLFDRDGTLKATTAQEGVLRVRDQTPRDSPPSMPIEVPVTYRVGNP